MPSTIGRRSDSSSCAPPRPMNCRCARSAIIIGLQFGLVGFILLPVVLSGVALTAWRGYRRGDAVAILLSTAVIVPFGYFFWKSLTLRVGDTWPMFMWPIGFAAAAINIAMLPREGWPAWMVKSTIAWASGRDRFRHRLRRSGVSLLCRRPWNFIGRTDPIGGEAGYEQVVDRAQAAAAKDRRDLDRNHGLPDLRHAALVFQGPRAGDPDQRARPVSGLSRSRHEFDQGPYRALCRHASPTMPARCGTRPRRSGNRSNGSSEAGAGS